MKALVAMSGGVDSSVAALLLKNSGHECVGVTMKLFANADVGERASAPCCSLADASDAARVAMALGFPHYVFDFTDEFRAGVMDRFARSYMEGATPNPCIDCNARLKFGLLLDRALSMGFDKLATGHYARIESGGAGGRWLLKRAVDADKDQSYFLYGMTQRQLAHTLFPLGGMTKAQAREAAQGAGLATAQKRESQDICFVRDGGYAAFVEAYSGRASAPGDFVDEGGRVLGRHSGIARYTIGQRKGLGIALGHPVFVAAIRPETNEVVLAGEGSVYKDAITAYGLNWISVPPPAAPLRCMAQVRYRSRPVRAEVVPMAAASDAGPRAYVRFEEPVRAPARGQAVVFYDGDTVVGGGRIES